MDPLVKRMYAVFIHEEMMEAPGRSKSTQEKVTSCHCHKIMYTIFKSESHDSEKFP